MDRRLWAHIEQTRRGHRQAVTMMWLGERLHRAKRVPSLAILLNPNAKALTGDEKAQRQAAHDDVLKQMEG